MSKPRKYNGVYRGENLDKVAFPLGGIGAGMICLDGPGSLSHASLRNRPDVFNEPLVFGALHVRGAKSARVLEGPVPLWKAFGPPGTGNGGAKRSAGLPRFAAASFTTRFPFGVVKLKDPDMPVTVELTGWSPFIPGDADNSSLPVAGLEYRFRNPTNAAVNAVFSFHAADFMAANPSVAQVNPMAGGFVLGRTGPSELSPFLANWQMSKVMPRPAALADAAPVKLSDLLGWQGVRARNDGLVDTHTLVSGDGMVYLGTKFTVPNPGKLAVRVGHDGGMKLFVDGVAVTTVPDCMNPAKPDRTEVEIEVAGGEHELMVAFDFAMGRGWGIFVRFAWPKTRPGTPAFPLADYQGGAEGAIAMYTPETDTAVDCAWFRGGWFDALTMAWNAVAAGQVLNRPPHATGGPGSGASLYVPFTLAPGASHTVKVLFAWYAPNSGLRTGGDQAPAAGSGCGCADGCKPKEVTSDFYIPWYAGRFDSLEAMAEYWRRNYAKLRKASKAFTDAFYDSSLPPELIEAAAANLTILKSPTCLLQTDGRFWGWEGCCDANGCCHGTCTHVWNYAQALPHLFPNLERTLRETEFQVSQDDRGHQTFRASLPIRPPDHNFHAAADGQLGGIVKVYREWRISGDTAWLKALWPKVKQSLDYCINEWDPDRRGLVTEPHHNTYDIEFWGPDGMCTSFYLSALQAAALMGEACGDAPAAAAYRQIAVQGKARMEQELWNGEYFIQKVQWKELRAGDPGKMKSMVGQYSDEARAIMEVEGPKYQYGTGCLSDGVLGDWLGRVSGLPAVLDDAKIAQHVAAIYRHNFRENLSDHANPQRPGYAFGQEGGLLLCSWPRGGKPALPFVYSDEVWTGIEYQVAAHLILMGKVAEGRRIVQVVRDRYDGRFRNPFNEYECGHWYARAMSSYALLQAYSGARYDAIEKVLYLKPAVAGDFRAFLATATGFGSVGVRAGKPFVEVKSGAIDVARIECASGN